MSFSERGALYEDLLDVVIGLLFIAAKYDVPDDGAGFLVERRDYVVVSGSC